MSESTIEKLSDKVDWNEIFKYQPNLSSKFVITNFEKITDCRVMLRLQLSEAEFVEVYRRIKLRYRAGECLK